MNPSSINLTPPEWVRAKEWTPEQQAQEIRRRGVISWSAIKASPEKLNVRPSDIFVATPPKSGTTWLMHICHQIRMGGSEPDFEAQEDVIPWLEQAGLFPESFDPNTIEQPTDPRVFWTHLPYLQTPKGGKMITCMRDVDDMLISYCRYVDSAASYKGRVSQPIFCNSLIDGGIFKAILANLVEWWEHRHDPDVLFVFFDDLKEDHAGSVRRIAKFMNVDCSEEVIDRVVHTTTHAEMARHHRKFESHKIIHRIAKLIGDDPPTEIVSRVRKAGGKSGEGKMVLPQEILTKLDTLWKEIVGTKLGFRDVNEMRQAWIEERGY